MRAPGDHKEAFYDTVEAFNIAEKYQLPVIVLLDKAMAMSNYTVDLFDLSKTRIDRGKLILKETKDYLRYRFTDDGISPRSVPGVKGGLVTIAGDEHDEDGHIFTEDADNRIKMQGQGRAGLPGTSGFLSLCSLASPHMAEWERPDPLSDHKRHC